MLGNSPQLHATVLTPERANQAYPLIVMTYPGTTIEAWRSFITEGNRLPGAVRPCTCGAASNTQGMLAVEDSNGYIYGFLRYTVVLRPDQTRVLAIDTVSVIDLLDRDTASRTLLDGARALAEARGCSDVMELQPV